MKLQFREGYMMSTTVPISEQGEWSPHTELSEEICNWSRPRIHFVIHCWSHLRMYSVKHNWSRLRIHSVIHECPLPGMIYPRRYSTSPPRDVPRLQMTFPLSFLGCARADIQMTKPRSSRACVEMAYIMDRSSNATSTCDRFDCSKVGTFVKWEVRM